MSMKKIKKKLGLKNQNQYIIYDFQISYKVSICID